MHAAPTAGARRLHAWVAAALLSAALAWPLPAHPQEPAEPGSCVSCHRDVYERSIPRRHAHAPFFHQECEKCHGTHEVIGADGVPVPAAHAGPQSGSLRDDAYRQERTVLLQDLRPGRPHDVRVTLTTPDRRQVTETFTDVEVLGLDAAGHGLQDRSPPRIRAVSSGPVQAGPFLSTTVLWETDEPATSRVDYGPSPGYGSVAREQDAWVRHHQVPLHGLVRGREYHFRVVSTDLYGNEARSEDVRFSTDVPPSAAGPAWEDDDEAPTGGRPRLTRAELFLAGPDLAIELETSRPTRLLVEWTPRDALPLEPSPAVSGSGFRVRLDDLRRGRALAIDACGQSGCHPPSSLGISHPVGVPLTHDMPQDVELPTLEGGIITCVSCHNPHGGDRKHFAQADLGKKICMACHTDRG